MSHSIDLNCDMGESFGAWRLGQDAELLDHVSSANVACGFHAGDPATMRKTVQLALQKGVAVGAHPGLPDLAGFGRRRMEITPQEAYDLTLYQIGALAAFVAAEGGRLAHVKPHGALYNMAAKDPALAAAIADAVFRFDRRLALVGLSGSELIKAGQARGLTTASEVFADRTYQADGSLTPRTQPGAMIADAEEAASRVVEMVLRGKVVSQQQTEISLQADTVCIHGDEPQAAIFAQSIRKRLEQAGVAVRALGKA